MVLTSCSIALPPDALFDGQDTKTNLETLVDDLAAELAATGANLVFGAVWGQYPA